MYNNLYLLKKPVRTTILDFLLTQLYIFSKTQWLYWKLKGILKKNSIFQHKNSIFPRRNSIFDYIFGRAKPKSAQKKSLLLRINMHCRPQMHKKVTNFVWMWCLPPPLLLLQISFLREIVEDASQPRAKLQMEVRLKSAQFYKSLASCVRVCVNFDNKFPYCTSDMRATHHSPSEKKVRPFLYEALLRKTLQPMSFIWHMSLNGPLK